MTVTNGLHSIVITQSSVTISDDVHQVTLDWSGFMGGQNTADSMVKDRRSQQVTK